MEHFPALRHVHFDLACQRKLIVCRMVPSNPAVSSWNFSTTRALPLLLRLVLLSMRPYSGDALSLDHVFAAHVPSRTTRSAGHSSLRCSSAWRSILHEEGDLRAKLVVWRGVFGAFNCFDQIAQLGYTRRSW